MKDSIMLTYLTDLSHNNDRQWYHAHKEEFLAAKTEFEGLVQELIYRIGKTDSSILNQNSRIPVSVMTNPLTTRLFAPISPPKASFPSRPVGTGHPVS